VGCIVSFLLIEKPTYVFVEQKADKYDRLHMFTERQCINGIAILYSSAKLKHTTQFIDT
jgi:hypothetical protein